MMTCNIKKVAITTILVLMVGKIKNMAIAMILVILVKIQDQELGACNNSTSGDIQYYCFKWIPFICMHVCMYVCMNVYACF